MITDDSLKQIMRNVAKAKRDSLLTHLQNAMTEFEIINPLREAAFLAQIAHESGEFRWMEEIWGPTAQQAKYEPPTTLATKLGNSQPGDGKRFKGRGPIQITGRDNYERFGGLLGISLVNDPAKAATPEVGFRIAGLYWKRRGLNELADHEMFEQVTKRINGGLTGQPDRLKYYARAKEVLGVGSVRSIRSLASRAVASTDIEFSRGFEAIRANASLTKAKRKRVSTRSRVKKIARKKTRR